MRFKGEVLQECLNASLTRDLYPEEALKLKKGRGRKIIEGFVLKKLLGMAVHSLFLIFRLFLSHFPSKRMKNRQRRAHGVSSSGTRQKYARRHLFTGRRRTPSHRDVNVSPSIASVSAGPGGSRGGRQRRGVQAQGKRSSCPYKMPRALFPGNNRASKRHLVGCTCV